MKYQIIHWKDGIETVLSESNNKRKLWKEFTEMEQPKHPDAMIKFVDHTVRG